MPAYKAIIEGRERDACGWTQAGTLLLADGEEIRLIPLQQENLTGNIWRIARLKQENEKWLIDGGGLEAAKNDALGCYSNRITHGQSAERECILYETLCCLTAFLNRDFSEGQTTLERVAMRRAWRVELARVVAVAWSEDRTALTVAERPTRYYLPIFLIGCDWLAMKQSPAPAKDDSPEYFTSLMAAAKYAQVTPRTISNWLKTNDNWLPAKKVGGKIRIARVDLDKCRNRQ